MTIDVTAVNDAPGGRRTTRSRPPRTRAYTFAAADFGFTDRATTGEQPRWRCRITTLPAAGTLHAQRRRGHRRPGRSPPPTSPRQPACSRRPPTPTAPATPASPSRCRTTAAPPTAASTSIRRPTRSRSTSPRSTTRPAGADKTVDDRRGHGLHLRRGRLRLQRRRDTPANSLARGADHHACRPRAR